MVYTALAYACARRPRALAALQLDQPDVARDALPEVLAFKHAQTCLGYWRAANPLP